MRHLLSPLIISLILTSACGARFGRLDRVETEEKRVSGLYEKSAYWGSKAGIYISIRRGRTMLSKQNYVKVRLLNRSGDILTLDRERDIYTFKRFTLDYNLYRKTGELYPGKVSPGNQLDFTLLGIESYDNVESFKFIFVASDSLTIIAVKK